MKIWAPEHFENNKKKKKGTELDDKLNSIPMAVEVLS